MRIDHKRRTIIIEISNEHLAHDEAKMLEEAGDAESAAELRSLADQLWGYPGRRA